MKLLMILFLAELAYYSNGQKKPHFTPGRNTMVHLFEWKWDDIAKECEHFLGPEGFAGVQISPPSENQIIYKGFLNRPWWERYQPVSYKLTTRSGTEEELADMIKRCNAVGVRIYVDLLMNAMAAKGGIATGGSNSYPSIKFYPSVVYSSDDFHPSCRVNNYKDVYNVRNCELYGLPDLDQSKLNVRRKIKAYIDKLIDLGVAGFRVDAAKHMWPSDLKFIYQSVNNLSVANGFPEGSSAYFYQEVPDEGGEAVSIKEYVDLGGVLEFKFGMQLGNAFQGNTPLHLLENFGPAWGLIDSNDGVVFIDNHDTQRYNDERVLSHQKPKPYRAAIAYMLAYPFYIPRLMSSFQFDSHDQGPPMDKSERIVSPEFGMDGLCTNGWVCEHRWRQVRNMVKFRNICQGTDINKWWDNHANQIAFSRGNKGFIAFTIEGDINQLIATSLPPGIYCDIISGDLIDGSCSGKKVVVDEDGCAAVLLLEDEEDFMIAIHIGATSRYYRLYYIYFPSQFGFKVGTISYRCQDRLKKYHNSKLLTFKF